MNVNLDNFEHLVDYLSDYLSRELDHDVRVIYSITPVYDMTEFIAHCNDLCRHVSYKVRNCDLLRMDVPTAVSLLHTELYRLLTCIDLRPISEVVGSCRVAVKESEPVKYEPVTESFTTYSCKLCGSPLIKKGDQFVCPSCGRIYYPNKKEDS